MTVLEARPEDTLILGAGFVGGALLERNPLWPHTRRPSTDRVTGPGTILFDFRCEETWASLPDCAKVVWTFPAADDARDEDIALRFFDAVLAGRDVLILASTSCYVVSRPDAWVDEDAPLRLDEPRVRAEEELRRKGASVLCLAGLFGGARVPLTWLLQGRIRNGDAFVNLIHVDDVCRAIDRWLVTPVRGERLNLSNGRPRRWKEVVDVYKARRDLPAEFTLPEVKPAPASRRVSNARALARLGLDPAGFKDI